jgi:hypothetical protein
MANGVRYPVWKNSRSAPSPRKNDLVISRRGAVRFVWVVSTRLMVPDWGKGVSTVDMRELDSKRIQCGKKLPKTERNFVIASGWERDQGDLFRLSSNEMRKSVC